MLSESSVLVSGGTGSKTAGVGSVGRVSADRERGSGDELAAGWAAGSLLEKAGGLCGSITGVGVGCLPGAAGAFGVGCAGSTCGRGTGSGALLGWPASLFTRFGGESFVGGSFLVGLGPRGVSGSPCGSSIG